MPTNIDTQTTSNKKPVSRVSLRGIQPFSQKPSSGHFSTSATGSGSIAATELFSRFTADIIKKDVPFTR